MKNKKKEKKDKDNPYPYELSEVAEAEQDFVIQVGHDFHVVDGIMFFPKETVEEVFLIIRQALEEVLRNGSEEDKQDARWTLARIHIHPLRIH